jgi:hypothetical protein
MSSKLRRLQEQRDALDALVEALRTNDGWLAYRAEALRDQLLEPEGQSTEGASTVKRVRIALVERDEALRQGREDLAGRALWRSSGRWRWPLSAPNFSRTAQPSRERRPGEVKPRRG